MYYRGDDQMQSKNALMIFAFILLVLIALVSCSNTSQEKVLNHSSDPNQLTVNGIGIIELDENPTTGYKWYYEIKDSGILQLIDDTYIPPKTGLVGAGGKHVWKFKAVDKGTANIIFNYYRPWEGKENSVKTYEYIVQVK